MRQDSSYQLREIEGRLIVMPDGRTEFDESIVGVDIRNVPRREAVERYAAYLRQQSGSFADFAGLIMSGSPTAPLYTAPVTLRPGGGVLQHLVDLQGGDPHLVFSLYRDRPGGSYLTLATTATSASLVAANDPCRGVTVPSENQQDLVCPDDLPCGAGIQFDLPRVDVCPGDDCEGKEVTEEVTSDNGCFNTKIATNKCTVKAGNKLENCTDQYALCFKAAKYTKDCTETWTQKVSVNGQLVQTCKIVFTVKKGKNACPDVTVERLPCTSAHQPKDCCTGDRFCSSDQCCESPGNCAACDPKTKCCVKDPDHAGFSKCIPCDPKTNCCVPDPANPGYNKCQPGKAGTRLHAADLTCDECCDVSYRGGGGGKYLSSTKSVSLLRFDVSGQTATSSGNSFTDYSGILGTVYAFNELTRVNITTLSFSLLAGTLFGGGNQQLVGDAMAVVGGATSAITFQAARFNGLESFAIRSAATGQLLAGGDGEPGRAATALTITVY